MVRVNAQMKKNNPIIVYLNLFQCIRTGNDDLFQCIRTGNDDLFVHNFQYPRHTHSSNKDGGTIGRHVT